MQAIYKNVLSFNKGWQGLYFHAGVTNKQVQGLNKTVWRIYRQVLPKNRKVEQSNMNV